MQAGPDPQQRHSMGQSAPRASCRNLPDAHTAHEARAGADAGLGRLNTMFTP